MKCEGFCGCTHPIQPNLKGKLRCFDSWLVCIVFVCAEGWLLKTAMATGRGDNQVGDLNSGYRCLISSCKNESLRCDNYPLQHLRKLLERKGMWNVSLPALR